MLLYDDLVPWYRLVDPYLDHEAEAASYRKALEDHAVREMGSAPTLLELGSGAGHNAFHLKQRFRCTLVEPSAAMAALGRELNPECEHLAGDMRTVRLDRTFDAVLVHDAVMYMLTEADLRAAAETVFVHLRPGGAAVFAPDVTRESFRETSDLLEGSDATRSLRGIDWSWDPDPSDTTFVTEYAFLLRENGAVRMVHDRHVEGLFPVATWRHILTDVGFTVATFPRPLDDRLEGRECTPTDDSFDECFVATKGTT